MKCNYEIPQDDWYTNLETWKPTTSRQREHPFLYSFVYRTVAPLPTSIGTTVKWPPPCKIYFVMKHKIIENGRTIMDFV